MIKWSGAPFLLPILGVVLFNTLALQSPMFLFQRETTISNPDRLVCIQIETGPLVQMVLVLHRFWDLEKLHSAKVSLMGLFFSTRLIYTLYSEKCLKQKLRKWGTSCKYLYCQLKRCEHDLLIFRMLIQNFFHPFVNTQFVFLTH